MPCLKKITHKRTVDCKISRVLEIIRVKNSYLLQFYEINIRTVMNFNLYDIFKKHDDDINWLSNQRKIASVIASAQIILMLTVYNFYIYIYIKKL